MDKELKQTWTLLRPHVKRHLPVLGLVIVLGAITAAVQAGVLLLFVPVCNQVLFPTPTQVPGEQGLEPGLEQAVEFGSGLATPSLETGSWVATTFREIGLWFQDQGWASDERVGALLAVLLVAACGALVACFATFGFIWLARWVSYHMIIELRLRLARHLLGLSLRYHGQRQLGDLLSRLSADVTTTLAAINVGLKSLVLEPMMALFTLAVAYSQAPVPTVGIVSLILLAALPVRRMTRRVRRNSTRSQASLGASIQVLAQMFQGVRTVKAFGGEELELERYGKVNEGYRRNAMRMVRAIAMTHSWTAFMSIAGVAFLIGALGFVAIRFDAFDVGQMTVFFIAVARINNHVKTFTKSLTRVMEATGAAVRIQALFDEPADLAERPDAQPIDALGSGIRLEGVSFSYPGAEVPALQGIDLELRPGETLALVGESGSGKSTLADLLARFIDPTAGAVLVDGRDLRDLRLADWTRLYALVGQVPFLFHASIGENIRYGRPEATHAEVVAAARAAEIHDFIEGLPRGYETDVADMGTRLSGGQRQRITIARALLKAAPLLLLDEATSALDTRTEKEVQRALERLMAERTVLVIAHRLSTIREAHRICVLDQGRIVELGTHEELLARGGPYARLHALQEPKDIPRPKVSVEPELT